MRLEKLTQEYGDEVQVVWRSFLLRPEPEERDVEKFRAYTESWRRPAALEPDATFRPWSSTNAPPSHSLPAAVAAKVAGTFGEDAFRRYHRAVMTAYFAENRTVSDSAVLSDVAAEAGLDHEDFVERLRRLARPFSEKVIEEHNVAVEAGIQAVPAAVVDRTYLVLGAVDLDEYRGVIAKTRESPPPPG